MPRHSSETQRHALAGQPSAARDKMWRAMRMRRHFHIAELLEICGGETSRKAAEKYIQCLLRSEYLRIAQPGRGKRIQVYTLIRNTGPFAPRAGVNGVSMDPNLEILRLREARGRLAAELTRCDRQLAQLGAFVEKSHTTGADA